MKAYNLNTLIHIALIKKVKEWYLKKLITPHQYQLMKQQYKIDFYTPNLFVKIGLFLFVTFIIFASLGVYSLFFSPLFNEDNIPFFIISSILFSIGCFVFLEHFIKHKKLYNSGVDEALLYFGIIFLLIAIYLILNQIKQDSILTFVLMILPVLFFSSYRYRDRLVTLILFFSICIILFLLVLKLGEVSKVIMPFVFMIVFNLIYLRAKKDKKNNALFYWKPCIHLIEFTSLFVIYFSGNYFVVREFSISEFNLQIPVGTDIPLAILFYFFTAIMPILYIYFGLKTKDKTLLWSGLIMVGFAVLTFKYYFSFGHPEITLVIVGIILVIIAYKTITYLKSPKHGFTYEEEINENNVLKSNIEAFAVLEELIPNQPNPTTDFKFGGGESGGAGSGGSF